MGEEDAASEKLESVENGNAEVESRAKAVMDEKGEQDDGVKEMKEDTLDDMEVEAPDRDGDKDETRKSKEISGEVEDEKAAKEDEKEEAAADREKQETAIEVEEEETKSEEMGEDAEEKTKSSAEEKVEEEEENPEEPKNEKGPKKRPRTNERLCEENEKDREIPKEKKTKQPKTSVDKEPKTPAACTIERPVHERKSLEGLVATIEKDSAKEFHIEKFGSHTGNSSMRSKQRTSSTAAGDLSQSIHNLPPEPQLCFEGETLTRFLKLFQRDIELARALDANLPLKFWIKQHFAVGVNEVTRALERMPQKHVSKISSEEHLRISDNGSEASCVCLQAVMLASDCNPRWLTKHLPPLAASRNVPLIVVKDRKEGSLRLAELVKLKSTIAIGIKAKDNAVNQLIEKVFHGDNIDEMEA